MLPLGQEVAVDLGVGLPIVLAGEQMIPLDLALPDGLAKEGILFPSSGHDADKATSAAVDAAKVLQSGQLAIGHIDEITLLEQLAQQLGRICQPQEKSCCTQPGQRQTMAVQGPQ